MVPATLAFLHTIHIYARPSVSLSRAKPTVSLSNTRPTTRPTAQYMKLSEPQVSWNTILKARTRHHEIKLRLAEVAKLQKKSESLQEYMRHEMEFLRLIERDDALRATIARMIMLYVKQKHK